MTTENNKGAWVMDIIFIIIFIATVYVLIDAYNKI